MASDAASALSPLELLVLDHAGGDNELGIAYGVVQLYADFQAKEELLDATEGALLRLFDLGLLRLVEAPWETGYSLDRNELTR